VNLRRLKYFVKIVDIGSLTQAADVLHIAQPALSQHIATLETEFHQQLLVRTKRGVTPTEAGQVLYRHAQIILRQFDQALSDVNSSRQSLSGQVSVGLAPGTAASALALPLLKAVRARHPGILLYLNENFGTTLSELVMNGRMDMAVLYAGKNDVHGLAFQLLIKEQLYLVAPRETPDLPDEIPLSATNDLNLMLPRPYNYLRKYVDEAFARLGQAARVVAEIESASTLNAAIADGVGATILPESAARVMAASSPVLLRRIVSPTVEIPLALCVSDHLPMSEPAQAVRDLILELVEHQAFDVGPFEPGGDG
jgi:LysR family nitrogen assimilation transcriptional regulator